MRTSVNDLSRLVSAYQLEGMLDGSRVLRTETVRQMLTPHPIERRPKWAPEVQGLAWYQAKRGRPIWQHAGGDPGIGTFIGFGADGAGAVVITNSDDSPAGEIGDRLLGRRA